MSLYIDGYLIPVLRKNIPAYRRVALKMGKIFKEYGALEVRECVGEDLAPPFGKPFTKTLQTNPDETVVFSWIAFKSRAHRNKVNAAVMKDPRTQKLCDPNAAMPFNCKRMSYGGFKAIVAV